MQNEINVHAVRPGRTSYCPCASSEDKDETIFIFIIVVNNSNSYHDLKIHSKRVSSRNLNMKQSTETIQTYSHIAHGKRCMEETGSQKDQQEQR